MYPADRAIPARYILAIALLTSGISRALASDKTPLADAVYRATEIASAGNSCVPLIEAYIANFPNRKPTDSEVDDIGLAINKGIDNDLLTKRSISHVSVTNPWQWRKAVGRATSERRALFALMTGLGDSALRHQEAGRADVARLQARAAVALAASDRLDDGVSVIRSLMSQPQFVKALEITEAQAAEIQAETEEVSQAYFACLPQMKITSDALSSLIASPRDEKVWSVESSRFMDAFESSWDTADGSLFGRLSLAANAWRFACLARQTGRVDYVEGEMTRRVGQLKSRCVDSTCQRWLEEIVTVTGPMPKEPAHRFITDPNQVKPGRP